MKQLSKVGGIKKILLLILAFIAVYILLRVTGVTKYITLAHLQENKTVLQELVSSHYWLVALCYILLYGLIIILAFPAFLPFTLAGGFLFGTITGALYALVGTTIGSIASFFGIKFFMRNRTEHAFHDRLEKFKKQITQYGIANTLLMLHFLTVVPFFVINSLAAIANVSTFTFIWTTIVGSLPLVFVYSFAGQQLGTITDVKEIFSPTIMSLFVILIILAVMPMLVRKYRTFPEQDIYEEEEENSQ